MALSKQQEQAIIESVYDRAARGEPPLTPRLAAESRRRKALGLEPSLPQEPSEFERLVMRETPYSAERTRAAEKGNG